MHSGSLSKAPQCEKTRNRQGTSHPKQGGSILPELPALKKPESGSEPPERVALSARRLHLIISYQLMDAMCLAARRGVDIRLITPHVADKWYVHMVTQAHYAPLIEAGVKIYEYTPGFIHSKLFVSDDREATVGTINLDYRSLVHHLECGCLICSKETAMIIREDFLKTVEMSQEETLEEVLKVPFFKKALRSVIRFFAPLM